MSTRLKPLLSDVAPYKQGSRSVPGFDRVIKLSSNESPYPPSPAAIAAFHSTERALNRYPDGAQSALREALASVHGIPARNLFAGNGSEEAIGLIVRATLSEGDEMIVSENSFVMTEIYARSVGARVVKCAEQDRQVDVDAMLAAATERTRLAYVCSPNNPSGTYTARDALRRLAEGLPQTALLIVDAAYAEFADAPDYDTGQSLFFPQGRVVVTRTFSKAYGLAAQRIGWALAPDDVIDEVTRLRCPFNTNTAALDAAAAAVRDQQYLSQTVARVKETRNRFASELRKLGLRIVPSHANFVLITFPEGGDDAGNLDSALQAKGILGRPVAGSANEFRITIGTDEEMASVLSAIRTWAGERARAG